MGRVGQTGKKVQKVVGNAQMGPEGGMQSAGLGVHVGQSMELK